MDLLSTMQESSIKRLLENEVAKVTGLEIEDLKTQSRTINYQSRVKNKRNEAI